MDSETKKWLLVGGVVVVLLYFVLRGQSGGSSTGSITQLGPTSTDAAIEQSRLSAASAAFSSLIAGNVATEQATLGAQTAQTQANDALWAIENQTSGNVQIAGITAPAYEAAAAQAAAAQEAISRIQTGPAQTYASAQAGQGWLSAITNFIGSLFRGLNIGGGGSSGGSGYGVPSGGSGFGGTGGGTYVYEPSSPTYQGLPTIPLPGYGQGYFVG